MPIRDIYLKIETISGYSPVAPDPMPAPPRQYARDCMRNPGHEDGTIPLSEVNARTLTALVYREYLDPNTRSIANAVQVFFADGTSTERVEVEFPLGHRRRRSEGIPLLKDKFRRNLLRIFVPRRAERILARCEAAEQLRVSPVHEFVDLFAM